MKKNPLFTLVAAMIISSASLAFGTTAYDTVILGDSPVAYWPLKETSGTLIHDIAGTNNGTATASGLAYGVPGILYSNGVTSDTAIYFTNTSSAYISVPYSTNLNTSNFSVEVWLDMPTFPAAAQSANMNPLTFGNGSNPTGWTFDIQVANGANPHMYGWCAQTTSLWNSGNTGTAIQGKWSYYAMTFNGTSLIVYTNGVSAVVSNVPAYNRVSAGEYLYMGSYNTFLNSPAAGRYYQGAMENVAVYNYALTAGGVLAHYQTGEGVVSSPTTPTLSIQPSGTNVTLNWTNGFLQMATNVQGPWVSVLPTNEISPQVIAATNSQLFFRASSQASIGPVTNPPSITTQPASQTNTVGQTVTFTVAASGTAPLSYQWQVKANGVFGNLSNGGQFSGVTGATLTISSLALTNATNYEVVVTNAAGSVTSAPAALTVLNGTAPSISSQPASQTNNAGQTATFNATASGTAPLFYQWQVQSNGVFANLSAGGQFSGVTSSTLTIGSLVTNNMTNYDVVVTNSYGSVTSIVAALTVLTNSTNSTNSSGLTAYQTIIVADAPVAFWPLSETSGTTMHDIVSTNNGTVGGSGSALGVHGIGYTNNPLDVAFSNSASSYISIPYNAAMNTANFSCEMWLNASPTASGGGSGEAPFGFSNGNAQGWTWMFQSSTTALGFWLPSSASSTWGNNNCSCPIFTNQWVYYVATFDGAHTLLYTNGVLATTYAQSGHTLESGANTMYIGAYSGPGREFPGDFENLAVYSYTLTPAQVANHYFYGTNSAVTFITTQPASQTNYVGLTASFAVTASGLPPLSYQWQAQSNGVYANLSNGGQFSGVTNATLSISSLVLGNATNYDVVVSNSYGSVTSAPATLTVLNDTGPSIVVQPASQTNFAGLNSMFNVNVTGYPPLSYQWQVQSNGVYANLSNGGQFSGVTAATLTISSVAGGNGTNYDVIVTNAFGSVTSSPAALTITTNIVPNGTVKLMCIGDSITDIDQCDWRSDLANELTDAGYNYLMVGRNEGTACPVSPVNQNHHEGYSGYTSSEIINTLPGAMAANLPDVAMVHIGANDLSGNYANQTASNLAVIIRMLQAANSNMTIVVSQIIPCTLCPTIWEYDYVIPTINSNLSTSTSHVVNADVFDNFSCAAYFDGGVGPHPNAAGGQFMANVYYPLITSILNNVLPTRPPLPPPFPAPSGYVLCSFANNGAFVVNFPTSTSVAWGTPPQYGGQPTNVNGTYIGSPGGNGVYYFFNNVVGGFEFNNALGDPDPGKEKFGYCAAPGIGVPGVPETHP